MKRAVVTVMFWGMGRILATVAAKMNTINSPFGISHSQSRRFAQRTWYWFIRSTSLVIVAGSLRSSNQERFSVRAVAVNISTACFLKHMLAKALLARRRSCLPFRSRESPGVVVEVDVIDAPHRSTATTTAVVGGGGTLENSANVSLRRALELVVRLSTASFSTALTVSSHC
jgi:hypothetical protein